MIFRNGIESSRMAFFLFGFSGPSFLEMPRQNPSFTANSTIEKKDWRREKEKEGRKLTCPPHIWKPP